MSKSTFGGELRRLRVQQGLSLKKFAQSVHYDSGYLSKIENGLKPPTAALAKACDEALDTDGLLTKLVPTPAASAFLRTNHRGLHSANTFWEISRTTDIDLDPSSVISNGTKHLVTEETARELLTIAVNYRRAYRGMPAAALLRASRAHLSLILVTQPAWQAPEVRRILVRSAGESAVLIAALLGTDQARYTDALPYLALAQDAARENNDSDLAAVVLACRAFLTSFSGGSPKEAADLAEVAVHTSVDGASPTTRGWVAAVSSEQFAVLGDERRSRLRLDTARDAVRGSEPDAAWAGFGTFDAAKVIAYEGGNLVRLGRYADAVVVLDRAIAGFEATMVRHRCAALVDRAEAHLASGQVDAGCDDATAALRIAVHAEHALSVARVHRLAEAVMPTNALAARRLWADALSAKSILQDSSPSPWGSLCLTLTSPPPPNPSWRGSPGTKD